jgi:hypothetical protein
MSNEKCPRCNADLVATADGGLKCADSNCTHSVLPGVQLSDTIGFRQALSVQKISGETFEGQPKEISGRMSEDGGPNKSYDLTRSEAGTTFTRSFEFDGPYRGNKEDDERKAVRRILSQYNQDHGTSFDDVESEPDQNDPVDVWFTKSGKRQPIGCQVTRSDGRKTTGSKLGTVGKFSETMSGEAALTIMAEAIEGKALKTGKKRDLVLVLDGVIPDAEPLLDDLISQHVETIKNSPFAEIWYSAGHISGIVKRLK